MAIRVNLRWTFSSLASAVIPGGDQTTAAYARVGRTQQQYKDLRHIGSLISHAKRRINPRALLAFLGRIRHVH